MSYGADEVDEADDDDDSGESLPSVFNVHNFQAVSCTVSHLSATATNQTSVLIDAGGLAQLVATLVR